MGSTRRIVRASSLPRPRNARPSRSLQRVGLEGLGHEVRHGHGQHAQDRPRVEPAQAAERPAEPQPEEGVAEARADDVGRRLVAKRRQEAAQHPHAAVEVRVGGGVLLGPAVQPLRRPGRVAVQDQCGAVG